MSTVMDIETIIAGADREYPALYQLFGGYFHQDWREEYADPDAAVHAFLEEAPPDAVIAAREELDDLLARGLGEDSLRALLERGFDCNYVPDNQGERPSHWLESLRGGLRA